jgi:hypothetical protein
LAEVEGTITANGKPLDNIQVEFWPEVSGPRSIGTTDTQGRFKMMTDDGKKLGAAVGSHRIILHDVGIFDDTVRGRDAADTDISKGRKPRISGIYTDPQKTTLKKEVVAGEKNEFTLEVTP